MTSSLKIALIALCAAAIGGAAAAQPAGRADEGRRLYVRDGCFECHGFEGQGATSTGPRLGPGPLPWEAFEHQVRSPSGEMPPYTAKALPAQDLADIYAFLQTLPPPKDLRAMGFGLPGR